MDDIDITLPVICFCTFVEEISVLVTDEYFYPMIQNFRKYAISYLPMIFLN